MGYGETARKYGMYKTPDGGYRRDEKIFPAESLLRLSVGNRFISKKALTECTVTTMQDIVPKTLVGTNQILDIKNRESMKTLSVSGAPIRIVAEHKNIVNYELVLGLILN